MVLKVDNEAARLALHDQAQAALREHGVKVMPQASQTKDSKSHGSAERGVQSTEGQVKALSAALERRIGGKLPSSHPVLRLVGNAHSDDAELHRSGT